MHLGLAQVVILVHVLHLNYRAAVIQTLQFRFWLCIQFALCQRCHKALSCFSLFARSTRKGRSLLCVLSDLCGKSSSPCLCASVVGFTYLPVRRQLRHALHPYPEPPQLRQQSYWPPLNPSPPGLEDSASPSLPAPLPSWCGQ